MTFASCNKGSNETENPTDTHIPQTTVKPTGKPTETDSTEKEETKHPETDNSTQNENNGVIFYIEPNKYFPECFVTGIYLTKEFTGYTITIPSKSAEGTPVSRCILNSNIPLIITKEDFEEKILNDAVASLTRFEEQTLRSFFELKDINTYTPNHTFPQKEDFIKAYPLAEITPIYVFLEHATIKDINAISSILYKLNYTYSENSENSQKLIDLAGDNQAALNSIRYPSNTHLIEELIIPDTVEIIYFDNATNLKSVSISNNLASIKKCTFTNCSTLTEIVFRGKKAEWQAISKEEGWKQSMGSFVVKCTDGDIPYEEA